MATTPRGRRNAGSASQGQDGRDTGSVGAAPPSGTTGRYLVLMDNPDAEAGVQALNRVAGIRAARASDFIETSPAMESLGGADAIMFDDLGVAIVNALPDQMGGLSAMQREGGLIMEPERVVYAVGAAPTFGLPDPQARYLRGYRDAVNHLYDQMIGGEDVHAAEAPFIAADGGDITWGLTATRVPTSSRSGRNIRIAVLDTGFFVGHPDFAGRDVITQSFVDGETVDDVHGHGTHCIGTACGPMRPSRLPRYGIAPDATILAGKVLSNSGRGSDGGILAGMQWAVRAGCAVISMSLGAPTSVNAPHSMVFERVARRALRAGTLIVAAAGNESRRPFDVEPVGHPANCPSIFAVGAIDRDGRMGSFSNAGLNPQGGQVDIAAPGVDVLSAAPASALYATMSGTSMATPHVAGIAALWAEAVPDARGRGLMSLLTQSARRLPSPATDVGAGLVQAPD